MSVLTILCLASLAFFSLADPIPSSEATESDSTSIEAAITSNEAQIEALVAAIDAVINNQLAPLLADLQKADQAYLLDITSEACKEAMNYALVERDQALGNDSAGNPLDTSVVLTMALSGDGYIPANSGTGASAETD